ncbi:MAG: crna3 [Herbaspirillum sp.]|nr:crna3 [Herbaspirillum sp.]
MDSLRMDHLSWIAYEKRVQDPNVIVLLPVGALEQHGPHLPLGTDALLAAAVAHSVAGRVGGIVAPPINYGYKSQPKCGGGQHFPGTTSLDGGTLAGLTCDIIAELARHGVRNVAVVSGHYENQWFLTEGIDLARRRVGADSPLRVMRLEYWDFLTEATLARIFPDGFPGFALEHAAVIETSMMLHYFPDLVRLDLLPQEPAADFPPYDMYPTCTHWVPSSGALSSAKGASAEKGVLMMEEVGARIAAALRKEFIGS